MKLKTIILLSLCSTLSWGQTYLLSETMTAVLDKNVLTVNTTKDAEAMPDYDWTSLPPWFEDRGGIHSAVIEDKVTSVGTWAFMHCAGLTSISLANSVKEIGNWGFYNCYTLPSVVLSEGLTTIGIAAFLLCGSLKEIEIPASVSFIGGSALSECIKLEAIHVHPDNVVFSSDKGILYDKDKTELLLYPIMKSSNTFEIPGTVKKIASSAFLKSNLTSISIPNSVTEIGESAFGSCTKLTSITIPISVTVIYDHAFQECTSLEEVTVEWDTPLELLYETFLGVDLSAVTLKVPKGRTSFYKAADGWKDFGKVVEYTFSGNAPVVTPTLNGNASNGILHLGGLSPGKPLSIYNQNGQLLFNGTATADEMRIPLAWRGVLVVVSGGQQLKVMN